MCANHLCCARTGGNSFLDSVLFAGLRATPRTDGGQACWNTACLGTWTAWKRAVTGAAPPLAKKTLTLIVVPDHDAPVRRFQLEKSLLRQAALGAGAAGVVLLAGVVHYFALVREASENRLLRDENLTLRTQLKSIRERMEHIGATLERVERFDQKLRAVTLLSDPQRNLALGPTAGEPGSRPPPARKPSSPAPGRRARHRGTSPPS